MNGRDEEWVFVRLLSRSLCDVVKIYGTLCIECSLDMWRMILRGNVPPRIPLLFVLWLDVGHRCEAVKELSNLRGRSKRGRLGLSITSDPHHVRQT